MNDEQFLDIDGVAQHLKCSRESAFGVMAEAGALQFARDSASWRIDPLRLRQWLDIDLAESFVKAAAGDRSREYVYFIEVNRGPIKIGYTKEVAKRLEQIQVLCPYEVRLRALMLGAKRLESALHGRFKSLHIRGEWFRQEGEIAKLLERAPQ